MQNTAQDHLGAGHRNASQAYTTHFELGGRIIAGPLAPQLAALQPGDHLCSFYRTPAEQLTVAIPFLQEALRRGVACLYVADDRSLDDITGAMEAAGIDTRGQRERGALAFVGKWQWRNPGKFDVKAMAQRVQDLIVRVLAPGFSALWVAVDMTWTLEPDIGAEELARWESDWNDLLRDLPIVLLCQYNRWRLTPETLHHELRTHPMAILGDHVYPNFFYQPPDIFLDNASHAHRVDWMFDQLRFAAEAEQSLRESEERFRLLTRRVKDYAILMLDPAGRIISWSEGAERIKGYRAEEIIGQPMSLFYTPPDVERGHPAQLLKIAEAVGRVEDEGWRIRKDGSRFWANVVITALRDDDGTLRGFGKVTRDLTERKRAEESLQQLSRRLLRLQDEEQRRIARELQATSSRTLDELVAQLAIVKDSGIVFDWKTSEALQKSLSLAQEAAKAVRNVSNLLYPRLLDEAGLIEAIRWCAGGLTQRTGIKVVLDVPAKFGRMSRDAERTLFRIVQESLTNVERHAKSRGAEIRLSEDAYSTRVEIKDSGKGIPPSILGGSGATLAMPGVGINGMIERMRQLGGRLEIDSGSWGTKVTAILPASSARAEGVVVEMKDPPEIATQSAGLVDPAESGHFLARKIIAARSAGARRTAR
jgi:PAS domain S-box-containing protein